jgi:aminopeptidase N
MNLLKLFCLLLGLSTASIAVGQDYLKRFKQLDVLQYDLKINLFETQKKIVVRENVIIQFLQKSDSFQLDLVGRFEDSLGMKISSITYENQPVSFKQSTDKVTLFTGTLNKGESRAFTIEFEGIPTDGLIIGQNKFGDRTFFTDNWPMRAKYWFACVDHPSDKAKIKIEVDAPSYFNIVANGLQEKRTENIKNKSAITYYESNIDIPTKVIVFGAANFEKQTLPRKKNQVEITNFVYPQDKEKGFKDFEQADTILAYFEAHIGKFPFEKLYNVQSTTMYGGMENAGCIFYDEKAITGKGNINELIAHEIVHQWFGNSATELDWPHLWLSEGFATYLTDLYLEDHKGKGAFLSQLRKQRDAVLRFNTKNKLPLKDSVSSNTQEMLNTNAYQKGAWILHMLREQVGKELFWKAIATYYDTYKFRNARSIDFIHVFEQVTHTNLTQFHEDWICQTGHPIISHSIVQKEEKVKIKFSQIQPKNFHFSLEFLVLYEDNTKEIKTLFFNDKETSIEWATQKKITSLKLDPNFKLLFEEKNKP